MLTYRVFYGGIEIERSNEPSLGLTPEDAVSNGYQLFKLLENKFSSGRDLLFKLPDRKRHGSDKLDRRAVFIPRVIDYIQEGVILFDFWKIHYDLDDRKIFDEDVRKVDSLKDLLTLKDTQGALLEMTCAYDYTSKTLIWRDINGVSKTDIEFCLFNILGRKVKIIHIHDSHVDSDFAALDLESLNIDVETKNVDSLAQIVTQSSIGRNGIAGKLADIAAGSDAGRIQFKLMSDKSKTSTFLRKEVLQEDIGVIRQFLALANSGRRRSNYQGRFRAEGRLNNRFSAINDKYENRVIDLFQGLLIRKLEIDESSDPSDQQKNIDDAMIRFVSMGREALDGVQNASAG